MPFPDDLDDESHRCRHGYVVDLPPFFRRQMLRGDTLQFQTQLTNVVLAQEPFIKNPPRQPYNLTGAFIWCTVKAYLQTPDQQAVMQITSTPSSTPPGGGITVVTAAAGIIAVTGPAIATRGFPDGVVRLTYDIQVQDAAHNILTLERGSIDVYPDDTNAIST